MGSGEQGVQDTEGTRMATCWELLTLGEGDMGVHETFLSTVVCFGISPKKKSVFLQIQITRDVGKRFLAAGEESNLSPSSERNLHYWKREHLL